MIDKMLRITQEREKRGWSKQDLSFSSRVASTTIGQIESGRFTPYGVQLRRIAKALGFVGDPVELLEPADAAEDDDRAA